MKYVVDNAVYQALRSFYKNVAKKYCNVYTSEDVEKDFTKACQSIYRIENGLMRRQPRMDKWEGMYMATAGKWNFAYKIEGDTVYVYDACHSQNIHESSERRTVVLTESELKVHLKKAVRRVLAEAFDFPHGLSREEAEYRFFYKLSQLYIDGKITKDDGNELIHYGLYYSPNNKSGHYVDIKGVENFPQFGR